MCAWQIRQVLRAEFPGVQAIEALAVTVAVYIIGFAALYYLLSQSDPDDFSEPLSRIDALY